MIFKRADQYEKRIAIISNGEEYTYGQVLILARTIAVQLLSDNPDLEETRVVFMCPPGFDYVVVQWGIWMAGGIAVPLCTLHPYESLAYTVSDCQAQVIVIHPQYAEILSRLGDQFELHKVHLKSAKDSPNGRLLPSIAPSRRAMILYTSGTTSKPKGVVTSHANISSQIETLTKAWQWSSDDHILNILPLHHVHGIINVVSCALWSGATVEFLPRFDAQKVWESFQAGHLTLFMAVPTIYFKLIKYWEEQPSDIKRKMSESFDHMRLMVSGSAALPIPVLEKWKDISGHTLLERYGMTEIGMALSNSYSGERRPGHVGLPLPGVRIRLADENNKLVEEGSPGEIQVKGPNVFIEYWNNAAATSKAFVDGWFKTGDIAEINDGMYKILGRDSVDIIKSGGYKISALQIENVLLQHPGIMECAVVGIADEEWGEVVSAALVLKNTELNVGNLKGWLKERLPGYQIPRNIISLSELPKNALGKVVKGEVKALFD